MIGRPLTRLLAATLLGAMLVLTACSGNPAASKSVVTLGPKPSPSPSPPEVTPVAGTLTVEQRASSKPTILGFADDGQPPDGSVQSAAAAVGDRLDSFLDAAQRGAPDLNMLGAGWLEEVDPAAAEVLRTGLTNPENPVRGASYTVWIHVEPEPTLAAASVSVERDDGTTVALELVFDVTSPEPQLQLVSEAGSS